MPRLLFFLLLLFSSVYGEAQEFNCNVKIMHDKILNMDDEVFTTMEKSVSNFINTRKWTKEEYAVNEKIDMNVLINLVSKLDENGNGFKATLNIQATRPVFNTSYNSPLLNFIDRDFQFNYSQFNPLLFDDNRVSGSEPLAANLTAVLAYYVYLIIGLDRDSFSPNGGTLYLKKAQNIVNNAPESSRTITGWKQVENNRNRYWIIDQLLNPRFSNVRTYWYSYHRQGLDSMYYKPKESASKIISGIAILNQVNKENPVSILMQLFFNAKSNEILQLLNNIPKSERLPYLPMLAAMDVPNAGKYNKLK